MKTVIATCLSLFVLATAAQAANETPAGYCYAEAQAAANAIFKINGRGESIQLKLVGEAGQVETYEDEVGYFSITTNTGMGENSCVAEQISFTPKF